MAHSSRAPRPRRSAIGLGDAAAARGADLVERSLHAYRSEGLEPKPKKTILYVKECEALGAAIDGASGWVCAKPAHMVLAFATLGAAVEAKGATHETAALGTALLTALASAGVDMEVKDESNETVLMTAARNNQARAMGALAAAGANDDWLLDLEKGRSDLEELLRQTKVKTEKLLQETKSKAEVEKKVAVCVEDET